MKTKTKINGLQSLHEEKQRLKTACEVSEEKLLGKLDELKNNYPHLITDAILPFESKTNESVNDVLGMVNSIIFSKLGGAFKTKNSGVWLKFGMQMAQLFTIRGVYSFFKKKKEKKEEV